jgi:hypothetical protein
MMTPRTGAEAYFADRIIDPAYQAAYEEAATRIRTVDAAARALNPESEVHGTE